MATRTTVLMKFLCVFVVSLTMMNKMLKLMLVSCLILLKMLIIETIMGHVWSIYVKSYVKLYTNWGLCESLLFQKSHMCHIAFTILADSPHFCGNLCLGKGCSDTTHGDSHQDGRDGLRIPQFYKHGALWGWRSMGNQIIRYLYNLI